MDYHLLFLVALKQIVVPGQGRARAESGRFRVLGFCFRGLGFRTKGSQSPCRV